MSDKNHIEDAVLAAYDQYAPSVSEITADRCALAFREGFLAGHAEAEAELRVEVEAAPPARARDRTPTDQKAAYVEWVTGLDTEPPLDGAFYAGWRACDAEIKRLQALVQEHITVHHCLVCGSEMSDKPHA